MGHSLGGKTAMTVACKYPDRVDSVISVDAAPVDDSENDYLSSFTFSVVSKCLAFNHFRSNSCNNCQTSKSLGIRL